MSSVHQAEASRVLPFWAAPDLAKAGYPVFWEAGLLLDALYHALLRMISVYELEEERGAAGADVVNIREYKERLERLSA
jgi:hypothetical protein